MMRHSREATRLSRVAQLSPQLSHEIDMWKKEARNNCDTKLELFIKVGYHIQSQLLVNVMKRTNT